MRQLIQEKHSNGSSKILLRDLQRRRFGESEKPANSLKNWCPRYELNVRQTV